MSQRTETTRGLLLTLVILALPLCLPSCEIPPPDTAQTESTQAEAELQADAETDADASTDDKLVGALIHRIDMPLDVSLDACWAQVDEDAVPRLIRGMWQTNGLRVGILHADQAHNFAQTLPPVQGESRAKLYTSHYPTAVRHTPRLIDPVRVDLTVPPRSPTVYKAVDGRLQLLVRIGRSETGLVFLELTPHHYKQKPDLIPRNPLEKQLDGRVFNELSALLPITKDTAIVVGLNRPWPIPEEVETTENAEKAEATSGAESSDSEPDTAEADDTEADTEPPFRIVDQQIPPVPEGLGKSLMTGMRAGQESQILIVITMVEEDVPGNQIESP